MNLMKHKYLLGAVAIALAIPAVAGGARADDQLDAVLKRLDKLEKENAKLKGEISKIEYEDFEAVEGDDRERQPQRQPQLRKRRDPKGRLRRGDGRRKRELQLQGRAPDDDDWWIHHKPGSTGLTFQTPNGEITAYGRRIPTVQDATPGTAGFTCLPPICGLHPQNNSPVGIWAGCHRLRGLIPT